MEKIRMKCTLEIAPTPSPEEGSRPGEGLGLEPQPERLYHRSASIIQRTWRRHVDINVFKYFKHLVSLIRNQGDPRMLLHSVNPREADMLDAAAGVYIRFRLGGTSFPPSIYYKIFTHRPIVDMCANSPRDYTHPGTKRPVPRQVHNGRPLVRENQAGWYRRVENNGWRPLSGKVALLGDIITVETNRKIEFHHSKLQRRQDLERKRRRRKIEWMTQMYKQGCLHARTDHPEAAALVKGSAQGMMDAMETLGVNDMLEWEVDELLEWTNALNFDEYMREWKHMGTSGSSENSKVPVDNGDAESKLAQYRSSGLGQEDCQIGTYSSMLHPPVSSFFQSEHTKPNISGWSMATIANQMS